MGMGPKCDRGTVEALHKMGDRIAERWDGCLGLHVIADHLPLGVTIRQFKAGGVLVASWSYFGERNGKFIESSTDYETGVAEREVFDSIDDILAAW